MTGQAAVLGSGAGRNPDGRTEGGQTWIRKARAERKASRSRRRNSLTKTSKKGTVELTEDELDKASGGKLGSIPKDDIKF